MKLLYCYVAFTDRDGNTSPLRGMRELELNFSTTNVYNFEKKPGSQSDILHCCRRETPLPEHFWANGESNTNIYNVNVLAGMNGSGKTTAIHYLMDLLNYIYYGFGQALSDRDRFFRHDPSSNRNLLLFDTDKGLRILDLWQGKAYNRLHMDGFPVLPLFLDPSEAENILRGLKVINLSNTLTQRDYALHSKNDERLRNNFIYDCTLGAAIGSDLGGFFSYEVYKQVAFLFEPRQVEERRTLQDTIPELRLPRALKLRPLEKRFEKTIAALAGMKDVTSPTAHWLQNSLPSRLAILCAVSYLENMIALTGLHVCTYPQLLTIPNLATQARNETLLAALFEFINQAEKWVSDVLCSEIVSGSDDGTLRVWDAASGQCLQTLKGHSNWVNCVAGLPDAHVVSGSDDSTLRAWDTFTGQCLQTLKGHSKNVYCVTVLPDGRVVSGSVDNTLRIWDAASGKCLRTLEGHSAFVFCLTVFPDGRVVSGSEDRTLRVWDATSGKCLQTLKGHSYGIRCVAVLPDGRVVSGSNDCTLRVWDATSGKCLQTLEGHSAGVNCVAVLPDGRVVSGAGDSTLRVWDAESGKCLQTLEGHRSGVNCVAVLTSRRMVSGSDDGTLRVWDTESGKCLHELKGHTNSIKCVAVLADGCLVSGSDDSTLRIWDASTGQCLQTLQGHGKNIYCVTVLSDVRALNDATAKLITERADWCREYINHVLTDPEGLFSQFIQSDIDPDIYELPLPQVHSSDSKDLENSLVQFLDRYHKICTPFYTLDFDWGLSSGEENLLRLFSWLFHIFPRTAEHGGYRYKIRNNPNDIYDRGVECDSVLLFVDEADLTFHPEWQRRLIHILTAFLPAIYSRDCGVKDLQLVLTTHSPLMLGDVPRENIHFLCRTDNGSLNQVIKKNETFGQNIHTILKESFFLENGTVGQFAANKINAMAKRLQDLQQSECNSIMSVAEFEAIRQTIALVAPGVLRAKLEQLLREVEGRMEMPDVDTLVTQTRRLSKEQRQRLLRQLQEDAEP